MLKYYSIALDDRPPITGDHVDTLLKSLLKAGEPVTYGCGAGNCGACRYVLAQGEVDQKMTRFCPSPSARPVKFWRASAGR